MTRIGWCPGGRPVADMLKLYPGTRVVRIFVGPGDPLPAWDGPVLGPAVAAGAVVHVSFKTNSTAEVTAWAAKKPAGVLLLLTFAHEPEQQKYGDPTVQQFHAGWSQLVAAFDGHPMRGEILLGPVYTRYWWQALPGDLRWLVKAPVDFHGWDVYNNGTGYRTPDDLLSIPRQIAALTGRPYLVAELGAVRVPGDDGAGRQAWMRNMVAALRADGALTGCWFHKDEWDLTRPDSGPEQQTWRELTLEDPMPTYAQLQAEPYWGREVVTPAMDWLGDELCRRTGRPREAAGTKGDRYHLRGAHRSQEWILRSVFCTNRSYTVQSGLTDEQQRHIAGFDFTPGSAEDMIAQCKRILAAMKAGELDEVREFYGNVDGDQVVDGWNNVADRAASSDSSHLWHWHLTLDRRHCNDQQLMERILAVALGEPVEEEMTPAQFAEILQDPTVAALMRARPWQYPVRPGVSALNALYYEALPQLTAAVKALGEIIAQESSSPDEVRALLAALPVPEPLSSAEVVAGVLAELTPEAIAAAIPADIAGQVADEIAARLQG